MARNRVLALFLALSFAAVALLGLLSETRPWADGPCPVCALKAHDLPALVDAYTGESCFASRRVEPCTGILWPLFFAGDGLGERTGQEVTLWFRAERPTGVWVRLCRDHRQPSGVRYLLVTEGGITPIPVRWGECRISFTL